MRTTLNLDEDVLAQAKRLAAKTKRPFREVVNEALRSGLRGAAGAAATRAYRTSPHNLGLRPGLSLDNIAELLAQVEGEDHR